MTINDLSPYLAEQPANTKDNPYLIALAIDSEADFPALKSALNNAEDKYVCLDLSGSAIKKIPDKAFEACGNLESVTIPDGVSSIGSSSFSYCTGLESVIIPDSVTNIEHYAFYRCHNITNITILDSVKIIREGAFVYCTSLESVTFHGTIPSDKFGSCNPFIELGKLLDSSELHDWLIAADEIPSDEVSKLVNQSPMYLSAFQGDLLDKFYAADPANGTPGTYTTTAPVNNNSVWIKQP
jgi:hypothetical protein